MSVSWDYYDKFDDVEKKYLPAMGEGETMATQMVTAVTKLVYKWYNDGDVYDNSYRMDGWANDLSSYANWLNKYIPETSPILARISTCEDESDYEDVLKDLTDTTHTEKLLNYYENIHKKGSIYDCDGPFVWTDEEEEDDEDDWYEDDYYEDKEGDE